MKLDYQNENGQNSTIVNADTDSAVAFAVGTDDAREICRRVNRHERLLSAAKEMCEAMNHGVTSKQADLAERELRAAVKEAEAP